MAATTHTAKRTTRPVPFGAPHVFVLAVVEGPDLERVHKLTRAETRIGRARGADWALDDDEVSKHHCTIRYDAGQCRIVDTGSLNGTLVNERPLRPGVVHRLHHLDEIRIGATRLLFLSGRFKPSPARSDD